MAFKRVLLAIIVCFGSLFGQAQTAKHVILISIDGLRPEMYLDKSWASPHLQQLMKEGVYADYLKSVFPSYTYPSHTAMLTGALPARSKIVGNQPPGNKGEWYWYYDSIKVPTLWQKLRDAGKTTAAIIWPVTVGAPIDFNILPEFWDAKHIGDRITVARQYTTPKDIIEEVEQNATGKLDSFNMNEEHFSADENAGRIAAYLIKKYKPNFLALHITSIDENSHAYGRDHDSVRLALAMNDRVVETVLDAITAAGIKNNTTIIIVGDHGFANIAQAFRPNLLIQDLPARFASAGGSAFLYMNRDSGLQNVENIKKSVIAKLDALPEDKRKLFRIIDRKELDQMGADSTAILALAALPGLVFSGAITKAAVTNNGPGTLIQQSPLDGIFYPTHGGHHGFDPNIQDMHTGFIAAGAGIGHDKKIESLSEPDIAPLIAHLLGIVFNTPDGKLVKGIVK